jgi:hypothetical protein
MSRFLPQPSGIENFQELSANILKLSCHASPHLRPTG